MRGAGEISLCSRKALAISISDSSNETTVTEEEEEEEEEAEEDKEEEGVASRFASAVTVDGVFADPRGASVGG